MVLELIKTYRIKYQYMILSWILLIIYLGLFVSGKLTIMDQYIYRVIHTLQSDTMTSFMIAVTFLGSTVGIILICMICLVIHFQKGCLISIHVALMAIVNQVIKYLVARPRPTVVHLVKETSYSFPSAHAMASMAVFGMIAYLLWEKHKVFSIFMMCFPLMIGVTRIYLGVHFASDVIGGFLFSITSLCTVIPFLKYHKILPCS